MELILKEKGSRFGNGSGSQGSTSSGNSFKGPNGPRPPQK
jgi:hypothetical protein